MTMKMTENNGYATREQLRAPAKRRFKDVELPTSGLKVRIRSLFEHESELFHAEMFRSGKLQKDKAVSSHRRLIVLCVCDGGSDSPMFNSSDMDSLNTWDFADINHLGKECESHCGFEPGEIDKTEKNLETVPVAS
jgi:hypothetical protein